MTSTEIPENETRSQTIERLARLASDTHTKTVKTVDGYSLEFVDGVLVHRSRESDSPDHHIRLTREVTTTASFMDYLSRHHGPGTSIMVTPGEVTAYIDGDTPGGGVGHYDHTLVLQPRRSAQMRALEAMSNNWFDRGEFAERLNALRGEIVDPSAADVMALVQQLNISKNISFAGGESLADGTRVLRYVEEQTATGGGSQEIQIPDAINFELPYYVHGEPFPVRCDFRYKLRDTEVQIMLSNPYWDDLRQLVSDDLRESLIREVDELGDDIDIPVYDA